MGKYIAGVSHLPWAVAGKTGVQIGTAGKQAGISTKLWLMDTVCHKASRLPSPRVYFDQGDVFQRRKGSGATAQEQKAFQ